MNDMVFNVGGFSLYATGILLTFAFLWGGFIFYKKAIESHFEEWAILDMIVLGAFWGFMVARVGFMLSHVDIFWKHWSRAFLLSSYPGLSGWGFLVGLTLGIWWIAKKNKYKYIDLLDLASLGVLAGSALFWIGLSVINFRWQFVICGGLLFLGYLFFWEMEKKYRLISWYRAQKTSARSGFVAGFSLVYLSILYWIVNKNNGWGSMLLVVFGLTLVYIRSGRVWTEDINSLKIWKKKIKK